MRDKQTRILFLVIGFLLLFVVALVDKLSEPRLYILVFYLIAIAWVAWSAGKPSAILMALCCAGVRLAIEFSERTTYTGTHFPFRNVAFEVAFFLVFTYLLLQIEGQLETEKSLARVDGLTGVYNRKAFEEQATMLVDTALRYRRPFSVVYLDLDNFKSVNDRDGHAEGDRVLRICAQTMRGNLRKVDFVARLGGDEFALLLPETPAGGVPCVVGRLQDRLLQEMAAHNWPVTFSVGAVTFNDPPASVDQMLQLADRAMYRAKSSSKNRVEYEVIDHSAVALNPTAA